MRWFSWLSSGFAKHRDLSSIPEPTLKIKIQAEWYMFMLITSNGEAKTGGSFKLGGQLAQINC